jgi:NADH:ubiquinone oxidoreductase subunit D
VGLVVGYPQGEQGTYLIDDIILFLWRFKIQAPGYINRQSYRIMFILFKAENEWIT